MHCTALQFVDSGLDVQSMRRVDGTIVGRIHREMIIGKRKWRPFLQENPEAGPGRPLPPPNQGVADTQDEAKADFAKRYAEVEKAR